MHEDKVRVALTDFERLRITVSANLLWPLRIQTLGHELWHAYRWHYNQTIGSEASCDLVGTLLLQIILDALGPTPRSGSPRRGSCAPP
jgi:hypothetical protein